MTEKDWTVVRVSKIYWMLLTHWMLLTEESPAFLIPIPTRPGWAAEPILSTTTHMLKLLALACAPTVSRQHSSARPIDIAHGCLAGNAPDP